MVYSYVFIINNDAVIIEVQLAVLLVECFCRNRFLEVEITESKNNSSYFVLIL